MYNDVAKILDPRIFAEHIYENSLQGRTRRSFIQLGWVREDNGKFLSTKETPAALKKTIDDYYAMLNIKERYLAHGGSTLRTFLIFRKIYSEKEAIAKLSLRAVTHRGGATSLTLKNLPSTLH